jgi:PAS domain S-box-containing protein
MGTVSTHRAPRRSKRAPARAVARKRSRAADRLDLVTRAINEGVYDWDIVRGTTVYSERVTSAVGLTRQQLRRPQDWYRRIHPDDQPRYEAALVEHFKGRTERFECDYRYRTGDGSWRWARQHGIAQRDARGRAVRMIGSTGDITELKQAS